MNRLKQYPKSLVWLAILLTLVVGLGLGTALLSAVLTIIDEGLIHRAMCLRSICLSDFTKEIEASLLLAKATLDVGVAIATIGGIIVALLSYLNTSTNAALTNHIEHLKVFSEYVGAEIVKSDRLTPGNFDLLLLYTTIFSQSRLGKTTVSETYNSFLRKLNLIISESNERCSSGTPGGFSYRDHQRKIRDHLAIVGITVNIGPRNDYFSMERQLLALLHRITESFCTNSDLPAITKPTYY